MSFCKLFNDNRTKRNSVVSLIQKTKRQKRVGCSGDADLVFRVRERDFSLGFWAIRPLEFSGARSKVALRGEAYEWAPVLRSFDKLREVGVSSYLSFTLCLSVFTMFELIEAASGRLIGPKAWNRIVRKF